MPQVSVRPRATSPAPRPPVPPRAGLLGRLPYPVLLAVLTAAALVSMAAGVAVGSVDLALTDVAAIVWSRLTGDDPAAPGGTAAIVWELRLPRVLLAMLVGAALTTVGVVVQALARNALADPFLLGVSSGASVGAVSVLLFAALSGLGAYALTAGGFLGALVAVVVVFLLAQRGGRLDPVRLVLTGVSVSFCCEAITGLLVFTSDPRAAQRVLFWLLGSCARATWPMLAVPAVVLLAGVVVLLLRAGPLNALAAGAETAVTLGVDVRRLRWLLFAVASLLTGAAVAAAGVIGFVGLVLPHLVRLLVGTDHRRVLPVGVLLGGTFLVWADLLARTVAAPSEIPVGVITAGIGGPVFLALLRRGVAA
jgi:iron complex transport system permease protein